MQRYILPSSVNAPPATSTVSVPTPGARPGQVQPTQPLTQPNNPIATIAGSSTPSQYLAYIPATHGYQTVVVPSANGTPQFAFQRRDAGSGNAAAYAQFVPVQYIHPGYNPASNVISPVTAASVVDYSGAPQNQHVVQVPAQGSQRIIALQHPGVQAQMQHLQPTQISAYPSTLAISQGLPLHHNFQSSQLQNIHSSQSGFQPHQVIQMNGQNMHHLPSLQHQQHHLSGSATQMQPVIREQNAVFSQNSSAKSRASPVSSDSKHSTPTTNIPSQFIIHSSYLAATQKDQQSEFKPSDVQPSTRKCSPPKLSAYSNGNSSSQVEKAVVDTESPKDSDEEEYLLVEGGDVLNSSNESKHQKAHQSNSSIPERKIQKEDDVESRKELTVASQIRDFGASITPAEAEALEVMITSPHVQNVNPSRHPPPVVDSFNVSSSRPENDAFSTRNEKSMENRLYDSSLSTVKFKPNDKNQSTSPSPVRSPQDPLPSFGIKRRYPEGIERPSKIAKAGHSTHSMESNDRSKEEDSYQRSNDDQLYRQVVGEPLKAECPKCSNEFLYPQGHEKVRCPHCGEIVEVPSPQETEESKRIEQRYYEILGEFQEHFSSNSSALVWLARAMPTRSFKLPIPKNCRWPRANAGQGGYAGAFRKLGLSLRDADTKSGHWHYWYLEPALVKFRELQRALARRWKESPNYSVEEADLAQMENELPLTFSKPEVGTSSMAGNGNYNSENKEWTNENSEQQTKSEYQNVAPIKSSENFESNNSSRDVNTTLDQYQSTSLPTNSLVNNPNVSLSGSPAAHSVQTIPGCRQPQDSGVSPSIQSVPLQGVSSASTLDVQNPQWTPVNSGVIQSSTLMEPTVATSFSQNPYKDSQVFNPHHGITNHAQWIMSTPQNQVNMIMTQNPAYQNQSSQLSLQQQFVRSSNPQSSQIGIPVHQQIPGVQLQIPGHNAGIQLVNPSQYSYSGNYSMPNYIQYSYQTQPTAHMPAASLSIPQQQQQQLPSSQQGQRMYYVTLPQPPQ